MKLEKKHWIIIGVVIAVIAVWYFFLRKKKAESNYRVAAGSAVGGCRDSRDCGMDKHCENGKCVSDDLVQRTAPVSIAPNVIAGMGTAVSQHPKCVPGTTWNDAAAKCIPDNMANLKWPSWLVFKRACPSGFVLDPKTKGCIHAYEQ